MSFLLVAGCATAGPNFQKVTDSDKRYTFSDFAVKPPAGVDWYAVQIPHETSAHGIIFYKKLPASRYAATHSFFISMQSEAVTNTFDNPEQFHAFAQMWLNQVEPDRYKPLEDRCVLDHRFGDYCVRFQNKVQDFRAHVGGAVLVMDSEGYLFLHPNTTNLLVLITCSERGRSDELDPSLKSAADKFIESVELR
jgi:hypothetical protein